MFGNRGKRSSVVEPIMAAEVQEFEIDESIKYNDAVVEAFAVWRRKTIEHRNKKHNKQSIWSRIVSRFKENTDEAEYRKQLIKDMELCVIYASIWDNDSLLSTIPYMPIKLAYVCAFMNIILPGSGTLVGAVSVFLNSNPQGLTKRDTDVLQECFTSNVCVGLSQMFTVTFLLVGWIWSIVWGINMVLLSRHHNYLVDQEIHRRKTLSFANKLFK